MRPFILNLQAAFLLTLLGCAHALAGPVKEAAGYLVENQLDAGNWGETGFTGECTAGLCRSFELMGDPSYKTAAEDAGQFILSQAGYDSASGYYSGCTYAAEAYALSRLSEISANPAKNQWRFAAADLFDAIRTNNKDTQSFIDGLLSDYGNEYIGTSVYDLSRFTVAAGYVEDQDLHIWRSNVIETLADAGNDSDCPVTALGAAVWALAVTGKLDDTVLEGSSSYLNGMMLSELPGMIAGLQAEDGSFAWYFDGTFPAYTEPTSMCALALKAAGGYYSEVSDGVSFLASGIDTDGACYFKAGDNSSGSAYYYSGETLEAMSFCMAGDADRNGECYPPVDVVYIYRALRGFDDVAPPQWRQWDPSIPPDAELRSNVTLFEDCYDIDGNGEVYAPVDIVYMYRALRCFNDVAPAQWRTWDPTIPPDEELAEKAFSLCSCVPTAPSCQAGKGSLLFPGSEGAFSKSAPSGPLPRAKNSRRRTDIAGFYANGLEIICGAALPASRSNMNCAPRKGDQIWD